MIQRVEAIYSGVLEPTRELSLRDQQRVRLTVETIDEPESDREAAIARLRTVHSAVRLSRKARAAFGLAMTARPPSPSRGRHQRRRSDDWQRAAHRSRPARSRRSDAPT